MPGFAQALEIFDSMQAGGLQPNHITYTAVLSACAREGQHRLARDVFDRMAVAGVVPDEQAYATLMRAYARAGHAIGATAVVEEMRAAGIKLVRAAACVCAAFVRCGSTKRQPGEAGQLFYDA